MSDPNPVLKLVVTRNVPLTEESRPLVLFLQNVERPELSNETLPFCVSFDRSEFKPINTSSISFIPVVRSSTLLHDTFDWSTDAKSKVKFGVVSVTMEHQVCCVSSSDRSHATGDIDVWLLAIKRMVFRKSLVVGRFLCWIPRALQQHRHRLQTGRGLRSTSDVSRLLSRRGLACCCAETKPQSFKLNNKRSPRGASGTWHQRAGKVRRCHGVPWTLISYR